MRHFGTHSNSLILLQKIIVRFQSTTALNSAVSELKFCKTVSVGISEIKKYSDHDYALKS